MSRISILKQSIRTAAAALVLVGLLSPANATNPHDAVSVFPDLPISATADHPDAKATVARSRAIVLTSRLPWLLRSAIGNRTGPTSLVSAWERQQRQFDQDLDRKLIICRGC